MSCGNVPDGQGTAEEESVLMPRQSIGPSSPIKADCPIGRRNVHRVDKGTCQRCRTAKSMFVIRSVTYCSYACPFHPPLFQANAETPQAMLRKHSPSSLHSTAPPTPPNQPSQAQALSTKPLPPTSTAPRPPHRAIQWSREYGDARPPVLRGLCGER